MEVWKLQKQQMRQNSHLEKISKLFNELVQSSIISSDLINNLELPPAQNSDPIEIRTDLQLEIQDLEKYKTNLINEIELLEQRKLDLIVAVTPPGESLENSVVMCEAENDENSVFLGNEPHQSEHFRKPATLQSISSSGSKSIELEDLIHSLK
eukprot:NODE_367_length_10044_cov_0.769432.p6 type:complete len:153 gc:universal NODE_367_length_10044_cov_0.769432:3150-2692(-)